MLRRLSLSGGGVSAAALYTTTAGGAEKCVWTAAKADGTLPGSVKSAWRWRWPASLKVLVPLREVMATL